MLLQVGKTQDLPNKIWQTQDLPNKIWQTLEVALKRHFFGRREYLVFLPKISFIISKKVLEGKVMFKSLQ
jgi:hypothetical protein